MFSLPLFLTVYAGFAHAFEADHVLAVSNIVSQRNNVHLSLKDGIFWGLGHASTILLIGVLIIIFKTNIPENYFNYFEAMVGGMLIILGVYRLANYFTVKKIVIHVHEYVNTGDEHGGVHLHKGNTSAHYHNHLLAYGIGLLHGLAGSGAIILLAMSQIKGSVEGLIYLVIFGTGCILGMLLAAGLFSIPFSKKVMQAKQLEVFLVIASSLLCILFGGKVIFDNFFI